MGLSFDNNGRYVGWSSLFNYDSIENINASEELPYPDGREYIKKASGLNIDNYIEEISKSTTESEKISKYVKLLNYLNDNAVYDEKTGKYNINYTHLNGNEVLQKINQHEKTKLPIQLLEDANKNLISSGIQKIIQNPLNMVRAYAPITMEDFRESSEDSPKGNQSIQYTLFNPMMKMLMQFQNMTGKNVIGISANGEKASFMWHYYLNDIIRNFNEKDANIAKFNFTTTRIHGRKSGNPQEITLNTLPDVNFKGISQNIIEFFGSSFKDNLIKPDNMISQMLSASTDNAKELILAKINAGSKLAKVYLFLITMGFDIKDIASFMTSPAISFIDTLTEENIFLQNHFYLKDAIDIAKGKWETLWTKYISKNQLSDLDNSKEIINQLNNGNFENIVNPYDQNFEYTNYTKFYEMLEACKEVKELMDYTITPEILQDISEFENILEGANEFSNLATLLGMNQGLKTDRDGLLAFMSTVKGMLNSRQKNKNVTETDLDVRRFFIDSNYAEEIINEYEAVKKNINIFHVISKLPQFKAIGQLLSMVIDVDSLPIRSRILTKVINQAQRENLYIDKKFSPLISQSVSKHLIKIYINQLNDIKIPYPKGTKLINIYRQQIESNDDGLIEFKSISDIASFKYVFENVIIPKLRSGQIFDYDGSVFRWKEDPGLKSNPFIQSLLQDTYKGVPIYKSDLNMLSYDKTPDGFVKFQKYSKGLFDLQHVYINKVPLSDLFMLYNLIVNQNQYGNSRFTTLFKNIVSSGNRKNLINDYFEYIGKLDWDGDLESLDINAKEILIDAAPIVKHTKGKQHAFVKLQTEQGIQLYQKSGTQYVLVDNIDLLPKINNESDEDRVERTLNNVRYFILSGSYKEDVELIMQSLTNVTNKTITTLNQLIRQGVIKLQKTCK